MEYFVISAKFVPLKYYTLSSQLRRLTWFSVGCSGRQILSPGQIAVMRKWSFNTKYIHHKIISLSLPHTILWGQIFSTSSVIKRLIIQLQYHISCAIFRINMEQGKVPPHIKLNKGI